MRFDPSDSPFCAALARQARDQKGRMAIHSEGERRSFSFLELAERSGAWAEWLRRSGVRRGQLAALAVGNVAAFPELFFALRSLGAAVLAIDADLSAEAASAMAARLGCSWKLDRALPPGGGGVPDPAVRLHAIRPEAAVPEGAAIVKLTSGSTLDPRGACFTEEALMEGVDHLLKGMEITSDDRILIAVPLSHSYGFDSGVLSLAAGGTPLVLQPDVLPAALLRTMVEREVTVFPGVPALIRALGRVSWPKPNPLRRVLCASAPLSREAADEFARAAGIRVCQFFGATECGGISFEGRPEKPAEDGCVGSPLPGVRIELTGEGTVRVHSKANRFAVLPAQPVPAFVETGDRAEWTPEGRLRLLGRATLVANIGGVKVDLGALDAFLRGLPGVEDAAAVPVEDPVRGHRIVAWVESRGRTSNEILDLCRRTLSAREVPSEVVLIDRLPRTPRGKLDRAALLAGNR